MNDKLQYLLFDPAATAFTDSGKKRILRFYSALLRLVPSLELRSTYCGSTFSCFCRHLDCPYKTEFDFWDTSGLPITLKELFGKRYRKDLYESISKSISDFGGTDAGILPHWKKRLPRCLEGLVGIEKDTTIVCLSPGILFPPSSEEFLLPIDLKPQRK